MRRWLIAAGVVVVVLGGMLAVVAVQLDRFVRAHREWLAARIEDEIGRPIAFGDLNVTLRGGPGVRITDVRIPDDPSYGGGDLLRASEVRVTVRPWPALFGRYEIGRIVLAAPVLTIIRDGRGFNLETLGRNGRREREPGRARSAQERAGFPVLLIGLFDLRDGVVRYADRRVEPARELVLERVDISGSDVRLERPITLVATAVLAGSTPAKIELTGSIGPVGDPPGLDPIPLDLHLAIPKLAAASLPDGAAALDLSLPARLVVDGPLSVEARAQGTLDQLSFQGNVDATRAAVRWDPDFAKLGDVLLKAEVDGVRDAGDIVIRRGRLQLGGFEVEAIGTMRPRGAVDMKIDSNHAELAELAAVLPAATGAEVGGGVEAHLTVSGTLAAEPPPAVGGTVALDGVRGRPPHVPVGVSDLTTTITVGDGVARMPATRFRVGEAAVEAAGTFALADRLLTVERASAELFGGSAEGSARIDLQHHGQPRFTAEATARRVALQPLLVACGARLAPHLEGVLDASTSLSGGGPPAALRRSLAGTVTTDVHDGVLRGVNLVEEVLGGITGVAGVATLAPASLREKHPELFGADDTRFEELHATAQLADGQARTDDLVLRTPAYTVTGGGTAGLDGSLDLTARFIAGRALTDDVLATVRDAQWAANDQHLLEIPIHLTGRLPEVRVRPDAAFVARVVGNALVDRANRALGGQKGGKDGKKDLVDDALRGLQKFLGR